MPETSPQEQDGHEAKKHARRFWWVVTGTVALLLGLIAYVIFGYDCAPPEDAWLIPEPFAGANGLDSISELTKKDKAAFETADRERGKLPEAVRKVENGHLEEAQAFLAKHRVIMEDLDAFLAANQGPLPYPGGDEMISFSSDAGYLNVLQMGANLMAMRGRVLSLEGHVQESVDQSLILLRVGWQLSRKGGFLIHWLVAITIQQIGRVTLEYTANLHPFDNATLSRIEKTLVATEINPRDFKETMKVEYIAFKHTFASTKVSRSEFRSMNFPGWAALTVKPNLTLTTMLELQRPVFDACDTSWHDAYAMAQIVYGKFAERQEHPMQRYLSTNIGGNMLLAEIWQPMEILYEKSVRNAAFHRLLVLMLALRRFEINESSLPENLQELCPKYLPSVPLDPYDNSPMRWNSKTKVVYSIGKDLKDDGGSVSTPYVSKDKDVGSVYWWRGAK